LFIDFACKLPELQLDDPQIRHFFRPYPKLRCDRGVEQNWVLVENNVLRFKSNLSQIHPGFRCLYIGYSRGVDDSASPIQHEEMEIYDGFTVSFEFAIYFEKLSLKIRNRR